jgi:hypothetical protein
MAASKLRQKAVSGQFSAIGHQLLQHASCILYPEPFSVLSVSWFLFILH